MKLSVEGCIRRSVYAAFAAGFATAAVPAFAQTGGEEKPVQGIQGHLADADLQHGSGIAADDPVKAPLRSHQEPAEARGGVRVGSRHHQAQIPFPQPRHPYRALQQQPRIPTAPRQRVPPGAVPTQPACPLRP